MSFAFQHQYVLVFGGPHFVEIRNVETGSMSQVIQGNNIHCLFTNTPPSLQQAHPPQFFVTKKELHVHAVTWSFWEFEIEHERPARADLVSPSVPGLPFSSWHLQHRTPTGGLITVARVSLL
jgi:hypothetical protein